MFSSEGVSRLQSDYSIALAEAFKKAKPFVVSSSHWDELIEHLDDICLKCTDRDNPFFTIGLSSSENVQRYLSHGFRWDMIAHSVFKEELLAMLERDAIVGPEFLKLRSE